MKLDGIYDRKFIRLIQSWIIFVASFHKRIMRNDIICIFRCLSR